MTIENISRSISTKECCRPLRGLNPRPPGRQSDAHQTEPLRPAFNILSAVTLAKIKEGTDTSFLYFFVGTQ